jgi:iron complex outermembrane receptor protein
MSFALPFGPERRKSIPRSMPRPILIRFLTGLVMLCSALAASAQSTDPVPSPTTLKGLTIDQLLDIDVTSVSKRPEKLFDAASAIQVISSDDVRRSGATSVELGFWYCW